MKTRILLTLGVIVFSRVLMAQNISKDTIKIKEVVVTGTKVQVSRNNLPLAVSVISEKEINNSGKTALLPIISARVPGVFVTERGVMGFGVAAGSAGSISIRGVGGSPNTQVLVLIDGLPQFMGIMGHPLPDAYVASDVERVEVIRGPASILYGSNAMGGVLNIITRQQKKDGMTANARLMYGSYNTQKYMANGGYKKNKFSVFASINKEKTDGCRDSSDFNIKNGYIKTGYDLNSNIKLVADVNLSKFKARDPGPISGHAGELIDIFRGRVSFSIENNYKKAEGALRYYSNFGKHNISDGYYSKDHFNGLMFYQGLKLFRNNTITLGIDYKNFGGIAENVKANNGEGIVFGDKTITETGVYALIQQTWFKKLILNGGLRSEHNSKYGKELIPQIGIVWHPYLKTTLKGSISKGFRSPTIRELYLWTPANEDLKPESMMNYEIGIIQNTPGNKLRFELTGYIEKGSNMIRLVFTDHGPEYLNTGEFHNKGIEFACHYKPFNKLSFNTNYSFLHMREPVIASPEQQLFVEGNYITGKFRFNLNVQHIHNLYTRLENKQAGIPVAKQNYTLLNTRITFNANKFIEVFILGENLTNKKYEINYDYPMPGITFFGGVNININKIK